MSAATRKDGVRWIDTTDQPARFGPAPEPKKTAKQLDEEIAERLGIKD